MDIIDLLQTALHAIDYGQPSVENLAKARWAIREAIVREAQRVAAEAGVDARRALAEATCVTCPHPRDWHDSQWAADMDGGGRKSDSCHVGGCVCAHFQPAGGLLSVGHAGIDAVINLFDKEGR